MDDLMLLIKAMTENQRLQLRVTELLLTEMQHMRDEMRAMQEDILADMDIIPIAGPCKTCGAEAHSDCGWEPSFHGDL